MCGLGRRFWWKAHQVECAEGGERAAKRVAGGGDAADLVAVRRQQLAHRYVHLALHNQPHAQHIYLYAH